MKRLKQIGFCLALAAPAFAALPPISAVVISEGTGVCEEYPLTAELPVYRDPELFLSTMKEDYGDREANWKKRLKESPILTTVRGRVSFQRIGPDQPYKEFSYVSKLYGLHDPRPKGPVLGPPLMFPVLFCGASDAYADTPGFILVDDLKRATRPSREAKGGLPPSTYPNPIPEWKKQPGG